MKYRISDLFVVLVVSMIAGCSPQSPPSPAPGTFVSRDKLADVGFGTPEAAFETMVWAMMNGNLDRYAASFTPELQADLNARSSNGAEFAATAKRDAPSFVGYQIVAEKKLGTDQVDLKFLMQGKDGRRTFSLHDSGVSGFGLQRMVKVGNDWKIAEGFRGYEASWDDTNVVNVATPARP